MKGKQKVVFRLKKAGFPALNCHQEGGEVVLLSEVQFLPYPVTGHLDACGREVHHAGYVFCGKVHSYHATNLQFAF